MAQFNITTPPPPEALLRWRDDAPPRFLLTVDTEEEFDWAAPFARDGYRLDALGQLAKFQQFCETHGAKPAYLVDYPVATAPLAAEILAPAVAAGRAEVGVQLHPWVNPPFHEAVTEANSFVGNLPRDLERGKLLMLRDAIIANFGKAPALYRAGRYGVGPHTAELLIEAGIAFDTSVRARFGYGELGGPDFRRHGPQPWWVDDAHRLAELPLTTVFCGGLRRAGSWLHPLVRRPPLGGVFARARLLERVPLTPEGVTIAEARRAIDRALDDGLRLLVFSFHSPSLRPGCAPYVRSGEDLDQLYAWWRAVFAHLAARGLASASSGEIMAMGALASRGAGG